MEFILPRRKKDYTFSKLIKTIWHYLTNKNMSLIEQNYDLSESKEVPKTIGVFHIIKMHRNLKKNALSEKEYQARKLEKEKVLEKYEVMIDGTVKIKDSKMIVIYNGDTHPAYFVHGKEYEVLSIEKGLYRIVDETGEDYLYPSEWFDIKVRSN